MIAENFAFLMERITSLFDVCFNRILFLSLSSQMISMVVKGIIKSIKNRKFSLKEMSSYGGMPSSHTAFIVAAFLGLGLEYGWSSGIFGFALVVVLIVLVDAVKLRGTIDKINDNVARLSEEAKSGLTIPKHISHTLPEVIGGTVFAVIYTFLFYLFFYGLFGSLGKI